MVLCQQFVIPIGTFRFADVTYRFTDSRKSRKIIHSLSFQWKTAKSNRKILLERRDIGFLTTEYLQNIREYWREGRSIDYMDKTYYSFFSYDRKILDWRIRSRFEETHWKRTAINNNQRWEWERLCFNASLAAQQEIIMRKWISPIHIHI